MIGNFWGKSHAKYFPFYLVQKEHATKLCKITKYYTHNWKFSLCYLRLSWWFKFLNITLFWLRLEKLLKKPPSIKVESFNVNFWPKPNIPDDAHTKLPNYFAFELLYFCCNCFRNTLKLWERSKYWSLKETGSSFKEAFVSADTLVQQIF